MDWTKIDATKCAIGGTVIGSMLAVLLSADWANSAMHWGSVTQNVAVAVAAAAGAMVIALKKRS